MADAWIPGNVRFPRRPVLRTSGEFRRAFGWDETRERAGARICSAHGPAHVEGPGVEPATQPPESTPAKPVEDGKALAGLGAPLVFPRQRTDAPVQGGASGSRTASPRGKDTPRARRMIVSAGGEGTRPGPALVGKIAPLTDERFCPGHVACSLTGARNYKPGATPRVARQNGFLPP